MILPRISNKILLGFVALIPMLLAVFLFASPHVYARTDARGYFTGVDLNGPAYCANCNTGLDEVAPQAHGPGLPDGFNDTMDKAAFIRKVHEFNDSGIPKYQTAAALYVSLINGYKTSRPPNAGDFVNFEARVNNPTISIDYGYRSDVENSAYYVAGDDEVFFTESAPVGRYSMIFHDSSKDYTVIKLDCGNPLGQLALPNPPPPDQPPVGAVDPPTCTISKGWAYDPDNRSASLYYYLYVNGIKNGPVTADKNSPDVNGIYGLTGAHRTQDDDLPSQGGWNPRIVNNIKYTAIDSETNLESAIGSPVSVGPCVTSACAGDSFSYKFGVNQPVDIGAKVTITGGYGPPYSVSSNPAMYITVLNSSGVAVSGFSDKPVSYSVSPPPSTPGLPLTTLTSTGPSQVFSTSAPGIFTVTWRLGGSSPITCTDTGDVPAYTPTNHYAGFQPYFRIEDGDAAAGEGFIKLGCVQPSGFITGFNRHALGSGNFGSGTNLAAIANGSITQFATGTDRGVAASASSNGVGQPRGLAFANGGINGGLFSNHPWCSADYYSDAGSTVTPPPASISGITAGKHVYQITGNYTLNAATLQPGADITIKVDGDVSIAGNILYNYGSLDKIPRFRLLVTGNIYVQYSPAVTELHGFYVAQPKSGVLNSGKFYTCSNGFSPINYTTPLNSYGKCNTQLNIIGSVSASTIIPGRTAGNYNDNSVTPAETFQNSPELWIFPATDAGSVGSINSYDSITNLPPVL